MGTLLPAPSLRAPPGSGVAKTRLSDFHFHLMVISASICSGPTWWTSFHCLTVNLCESLHLKCVSYRQQILGFLIWSEKSSTFHVIIDITRFIFYFFGFSGSQLQHTGLSCPATCGIVASWPGIEAVSLALEGRFLINEPPEKSLKLGLNLQSATVLWLPCFAHMLFICPFLCFCLLD